MLYILYLIIPFIYGIFVGSFLNVVIIRTPLKESFVKGRSHCMTCGKMLHWYELIPVFSYVFQLGKCRGCKSKISAQYPLVEFLNGAGWALVMYFADFTVAQSDVIASIYSPKAILYCIVFSCLVVASGIDIKLREIPYTVNFIIMGAGVINLLFNLNDWQSFVIGMFCVSIPFFILQLFGGMGGGDVLMMAAAGLLIGWKAIVLAAIIGCVIGTLVHVILMIFKKASRTLAFGPYLACGIFISMLFGNNIIEWYLNILGL